MTTPENLGPGDAARADAAGRLFVALDLASVDAARALVEQLSPPITSFKIGLELIYAGGIDLARELAAGGHEVFLDAKLLDIGNTVERATDQIAGLGARYLTIHATDTKTLTAAVRGRGASPLRLLGVTVMTNLDFRDLSEQGVTRPPREMVLHRARLALDAGLDGVIASPQEAGALRETFGTSLEIVTPGVRPAGTQAGDQSRTATPTDAIAAGADKLVIGRPITAADDPPAAAGKIIDEIALALAR
ncbi:orotidine-5'-phosphate decarboxylase [Dichotomicrobium thermohalophilum]|uniref:Orotidine 5'-phosphate decarboxylase n=1 Tax=Dichotomicrobium thermohalophilum TaxID=933063 RepID=A0A397PHQ1_9HYPH|nr:orotidine-5'-phosphate decarboxylase [Dichotomicrobium thermohalophilum]RIA47409.1 orotidine-5'-phosphate decarboxylase [Dichotomicrobium thermohalophilum]